MIYIVTFPMETGGPETAHQLGAEFIKLGEETSMFYYSPGKSTSSKGESPTPPAFRKYGVPVAKHIDDISSNVVLIPEAAIQFVRKINNAQVCIMWLSLGNYLKVLEQYSDRGKYADGVLADHHLPRILKPAVMLRSYRFVDKGGFGYDFEARQGDLHTYNCEYVHSYLEAHGVPNDAMTYLCGPISQAFSGSVLGGAEKKDIVAYNPKKGYEFTQKVIAYAGQHGFKGQFVPIQGMTPAKVSALLGRAKVYMDFGDFPGPERIPREAVTMGCNIVTSRNGAAGNDLDVPIDESLKFDTIERNIPAIIDKLTQLMDDYSGYYHLYDAYRKKVRAQVAGFPREASALLDLIRNHLSETGSC